MLTLVSYGMTGHGGSDGLHGYVPSLDYVIEDIVSLYL
jgi:acylglycerol lipase